MLRSSSLAWIAPALAVAACNGSSPPNSSAAEGESAKVVRPQVSWPAPASLDRTAVASLAASGDSSGIQARIDRSPVPVLVPRDASLTTAALVVEGEFYAYSGRGDGIVVAVQGTRAAHRYEGIAAVGPKTPGARRVRGSQGFVTENEGIRTASWIENGVAYTADVECSDRKDTRCTDEAYVVDLVESLAYAGGAGARGGR
ncbi:hypothetical protein AKJ09_10888 [Labilithrix luteola]|uniref:Lipoprotein n=1 Tax=Labilithrix luteola TaxID=1391654 RepID=A0A0K1QFN8_9BACT|nr:hypothetical protein [Labilithrix luteola]AKV04225.1 hypothetical protein AKJ09_10888 [Labilithrix luteola]